MTDRELAGCPFCGSSDVSVQVGYHMVSDAKVACNSCSGEGPLFGTDDMDGGDHRPEAIAAWNRRAPSSEGDGRDGERWRYVRAHMDCLHLPGLDISGPSEERIDAAIDAAIAAAEGKRAKE